MKLRPQTWIVLSSGLVLLAFTVGFAIREHQRRSSADARLAIRERERLTLRQDLEKIESRSHASISSSAVASVEPQVASPIQAAIEEPPLTAEIMVALRLESGRAEARSFYAPFFAQRRFGPEKVAEFADRLARHNNRLETLASELPANLKNDPADPVLQAFRVRQKEEESRFLADMESLLGSADFAGFQQFQQELRFWTKVQDFAGRLHNTDSPLTPAQASQLAGALVAQATDASGKIGPNVTNWESVFTRAADFLSPSQLAVLKTQHDYDETWRQLNRLSGRARAAANAAASGEK